MQNLSKKKKVLIDTNVSQKRKKFFYSFKQALMRSNENNIELENT